MSWEGWGSRGRAAVSCPGKTAAAATVGFWLAAGSEIAGISVTLAAAVLAGEGFAAVVVFSAVGRCSAVAPVKCCSTAGWTLSCFAPQAARAAAFSVGNTVGNPVGNPVGCPVGNPVSNCNSVGAFEGSHVHTDEGSLVGNLPGIPGSLPTHQPDPAFHTKKKMTTVFPFLFLFLHILSVFFFFPSFSQLLTVSPRFSLFI